MALAMRRVLPVLEAKNNPMRAMCFTPKAAETLSEIQTIGMQRKAHGAQPEKTSKASFGEDSPLGYVVATNLVDRRGCEHRTTPRRAR
jgi:hypothetical protein